MIKLIIASVLAVVALIGFLLLSPFTIVGASRVGVVTTMGKVSPEPLYPGFHWVSPISTVHQVYTGVAKGESKVAGTSQDLQQVDTEITVNFSMLPSSIPRVYATFNGNPDTDNVWNTVMDPAIHAEAKAVQARYAATDLIQRRDQVEQDIREALTNRFTTYGVTIQSVNITNIAFSKQFEDAIESKITAQQHALQTENEIAQTKYEAQKRVVESEANLRVAQNNAKANELMGKSLEASPALIEKLKVERWDGHYPTYMMGNAMPMIQMGVAK